MAGVGTTTRIASPAMTEAERWGSLLGGGALLLAGLARRSLPGAVLSVVGGTLLYHGARGEEPGLLHPVRSERAVTIARPVEEVSRAWMSMTSRESRPRAWPDTGEDGGRWDADVVEERPNERVMWRSSGARALEHEGMVRFTPAPGGRGTEVRVVLHYAMPAGTLGARVARLLGGDPGVQMQDALRRFKQLVEAGEVATTAGQPSGWAHGGGAR